MYFVYILQSIDNPDQLYVGSTQDLRKRLTNHNAGTTLHTSKFKPWKLTTYIAFEDKEKAIAFEKYLKSGSGREFRKKRL